MIELNTIAVIGGGQAGGQVAATLRGRGFDGELHLFAGEPYAPYERPPLSKGVLTGDKAPESCLVKSESFYVDKEIELHLDEPVTDVDPGSRQLQTTQRTLGFDALFLCTGSKLITLNVPGADLENVHYVRSWDDTEALRPKLRDGARLTVVGGGYVGLEVAAAGRKKNMAVTVVEVADEILARVVDKSIGAVIRRYHEDSGVTILRKTQAVRFEGDRAVREVVTDADGRLETDVVVIGIGIQADDGLAKTMGLSVDDGIVVDAFGRTSAPGVFAAGDVTRQPNPHCDGLVRLESWQNAQFQAMAAAKAALGDTSRPHAMVPWFWSDQGTLNIQMLGAATAWDSVVFRGPKDALPTSAFSLRQGTIVGHCALNAHDDVRPAKRLIESKKPVDLQRLSDPSVPLAECAI